MMSRRAAWRKIVRGYVWGAILSVCTSALWARSYYVSTSVLWTSANRQIEATSIWGEVMVEFNPFPLEWVEDGRMLSFEQGEPSGAVDLRSYGSPECWQYGTIGWCRFYRGDGAGKPRRCVVMTVPYWLICSLVAMPVALEVYRRVRRWLRRRRGYCVICGYDLRAGSVCCPECGNRDYGKLVRGKEKASENGNLFALRGRGVGSATWPAKTRVGNVTDAADRRINPSLVPVVLHRALLIYFVIAVRRGSSQGA